MKKFYDKAKEMGWDKPYEEVNLFVTQKEDDNGYYTVAFPTVTGYEDFTELDATERGVKSFIYAICCHTKVKEEHLKWALPLLVSDYYAHRRDFDNELIWAKKAMKNDKKLTPISFSQNIRGKL